MSIEVKRNTGVMGGVMGVTLKVNKKLVRNLKNNEAYTVETESESVKIRANQWFLGSEEKEVTKGSIVSIKTNSTVLFIYFLSALVGIFGNYINPICTPIGMLGIIFTCFYASKNWFKLEVDEVIQEDAKYETS